jgi:hypothetical protein
MTRLIIAALPAAAVTLLPIQADASWQYTRWGMSPEQVVAASKGTAHLEPDNGSYLPYLPDRDKALMLAKGQVKIGSFNFKVGFYFDVEKRALKSVFLSAENCTKNDSYALREWLSAKYGVPREVLYNLTFKWVSPFEPDIITLTSLSDTSCSIAYEPIPAGL